VEQLTGSKIATSYPNSTRRYFAEHNVPVEIIPISGSVELTPALGVAQAIAELTATGSTLRLNDLRQIATIYTSQAVLVANPMALEDERRRKTIDRLTVRLKATLAARVYRYIMMNAPREKLKEIRQITPGLKSPTIVDLADPDWVAVHTVVEAERFWDVIERLRELGASEILVTPIDSMIM
jgi:ATP phosphoribosyltransferase